MDFFTGFLPDVLFYVLGGIALASAAFMVGQRNPIYSAFAFIVTLITLSGIFGLLGSPFIAALQIVVYAGAIMVLFLFVMMLLNVRSEPEGPPTSRAVKALAGLFVILLLVQVGTVLLDATKGQMTGTFDASSRRVAEQLFHPRFVYVFEATSVLILSALVGSISLAKRDL